MSGLLLCSSALTHSLPRRTALGCAAGWVGGAPAASWAAEVPGSSIAAERAAAKVVAKYTPLLGSTFDKLSNQDAMGLELASRTAEGRLLPGGVRMIDVVAGSGPELVEGAKAYLHFKLWTDGFDRGMPIDASYFDTRPIDYTVGSPAGRLLPGIDQGIRGMREGGWRRLVVPPALGYGDSGLSPTQTKSRLGVHHFPPLTVPPGPLHKPSTSRPRRCRSWLDPVRRCADDGCGLGPV